MALHFWHRVSAALLCMAAAVTAQNFTNLCSCTDLLWQPQPSTAWEVINWHSKLVAELNAARATGVCLIKRTSSTSCRIPGIMIEDACVSLHAGCVLVYAASIQAAPHISPAMWITYEERMSSPCSTHLQAMIHCRGLTSCSTETPSQCGGGMTGRQINGGWVPRLPTHLGAPPWASSTRHSGPTTHLKSLASEVSTRLLSRSQAVGCTYMGEGHAQFWVLSSYGPCPSVQGSIPQSTQALKSKGISGTYCTVEASVQTLVP